MKILVTGAALAAMILTASPVVAQDGQLSARAIAQHQAVLRSLERERAALRRSPDAVFDGPNYVGADPDAFIRNDLLHLRNRD